MIKNKHFKPGDILKVEQHEGTIFKPGELVIVQDPDRYPIQRRELVRKAGYSDSKFFICVERVLSNEIGFYMAPRFRPTTRRERV